MGKELGTLNIEFRDGRWHATLYTPERLLNAMGGKRVQRQNLHTSDKQVALTLKVPVIARFRENLRLAAERAADAVSDKQAAWLQKQAAAQRAKVAELTRQLEQTRDMAEWIERQIAAPVVVEPEAVADVVTFEAAAAACVEAKRVGWKNRRDLRTPAFRVHAYQVIGHIPVADITTDYVLAVVEPVWRAKPETGLKLRQRIEAVLDYAKVRGWRTGDNPARRDGHLENVLPARKRLKATKHYAAMMWQDVPAFMKVLRSRDEVSCRAMEFCVLTCARTGEVLGAEWPEFDLAAGLWTVPGSKMKGGKPHVVPLADRAVDILRELLASRQRRHGGIVFPGRKGKASHDLLRDLCLERLKVGVLPHGFRSSFSTWGADTGRDRELIEWCLSDTTGTVVERVYRRSDAVERRGRCWPSGVNSAGQFDSKKF